MQNVPNAKLIRLLVWPSLAVATSFGACSKDKTHATDTAQTVASAQTFEPSKSTKDGGTETPAVEKQDSAADDH